MAIGQADSRSVLAKSSPVNSDGCPHQFGGIVRIQKAYSLESRSMAAGAAQQAADAAQQAAGAAPKY